MSESHKYMVPVNPKTMREMVNVAQSAIRCYYGSDHNYGTYLKPLEELGRAADLMRPTGPDGKHGDRHTAVCGCDNSFNRFVCPACWGKGWDPKRSGGVEPEVCQNCAGVGWEQW